MADFLQIDNKLKKKAGKMLRGMKSRGERAEFLLFERNVVKLRAEEV